MFAALANCLISFFWEICNFLNLNAIGGCVKFETEVIVNVKSRKNFRKITTHSLEK